MAKTKNNHITTSKTRGVIQDELRGLRKFIKMDKDPLETRIAYAMECAVRWMIEDTNDLWTLVDEAKDNARLYNEFDLKRSK